MPGIRHVEWNAECVYMIRGFLDTLDEAARMRGMTRSAFVQKAAERGILDPA